jgi:hypothetical protein
MIFAPRSFFCLKSSQRFWPEGAALSIAFLSAFSDAGLIGIKFYIKKATLVGGLSLGRKRPRSALQQSLAALQHMMY